MPSFRSKPATSRSSRNSIRLPQDLIDVLIDKSCHDKALLKTCSLVAKSWLHTSRIHLFRSVSINDATAFLAFLRFLRRPQSITPYIQSLFIEGNERPTFAGRNVGTGQGPTIFDRDKPTDLYFNQLVFLLSHVTALQRLRLKEFNLRLTPNDPEHGLDGFHRPTVRARYSLEYLEFIRCNVTIPELLPIFLSLFSSIKDLAFNDDTPFASYNSRPPIIHDPSAWQLHPLVSPPLVESLSFTFSRHSLDVSFGGVLASVTKLTTPDTLRTLVLMSWRDIDLVSIRRLLQSPECRCITHLILDLEKIFSTYPSTYLGINHAHLHFTELRPIQIFADTNPTLADTRLITGSHSLNLRPLKRLETLTLRFTMNGLDNAGIFMPEPTWAYILRLISEANPNTLQSLRLIWLIAFPELNDNGIRRSEDWERLCVVVERLPYLRKVEFYWYDPVRWFTIPNRRFGMGVDGFAEDEDPDEDLTTIAPHERLRTACDIVKASLKRLDRKGLLSFSDSYGIL